MPLAQTCLPVTPWPSAKRLPGLPAHRRRWGVALALAATLLGCQAQPQPGGTGQATEAQLLARIQTEVGQAPCSQAQQCRVLPIGAKPCGGPASWLAWSTPPSRPDKLKFWSDELARLQRQRQEASGIMSNCSIEPEPAAACQAGRCVLKPSALLAR